MASMKAKKGNPFEYDTAYSLQKGGYSAERIDDNSKGIDIIATSPRLFKYYIECKRHKAFGWNQLVAMFKKTEEIAKKNDPSACPLLVFKANLQPTLVMYRALDSYSVVPFDYYFPFEWNKREKGYKLWRENNATI